MQTQKISLKIKSQHLSDAQKEEMWNVYRKYYSESKEIFLLRIPQYSQFSLELIHGKIIGFSSISSISTDVAKKPHAHNYLYTPELA